MAWTRDDGWVWVFVCIDHHSDKVWCHVAKIRNRFAALQTVVDAVVDRFGRLGPDVARGVKLRHDWGSQADRLARPVEPNMTPIRAASKLLAVPL